MPRRLYNHWVRSIEVHEKRPKDVDKVRSSVFEQEVRSERFGARYAVSAMERLFAKEFYKSELYVQMREKHKSEDEENLGPHFEVECDPYLKARESSYGRTKRNLGYSSWCWYGNRKWRVYGRVGSAWLKLLKEGKVHLPGGYFAVDVIEESERDHAELRSRFLNAGLEPIYLAYTVAEDKATFQKVYLQQDQAGNWRILKEGEEV